MARGSWAVASQQWRAPIDSPSKPEDDHDLGRTIVTRQSRGSRQRQEGDGEMGRKYSVGVAAIVAFSLFGGGAFAASRYLITSTHQIKPSVLRQFQQRLSFLDTKGKTASMCPSGSDATGQCEVGSSDARCPGNSDAMGGGYDGGSNPPVNATMGYDHADSDGRGWTVIMANNASISATYQATVVCLGAAGHFAQDARAVAPAPVKTQIAREAAHLRSEVR